MPFHLPFQIPRIPDFLKRPLDPSQTLEAFEHYAEKAIDFATRHGGEIGRNVMDDLVDAAAPYAAFLDTTVDAFLPGINLWYGEKWAQSRGRKDPFKQKGGIVKRPSSQSRAQPKRDMPFGNKRSREWDDYTRRVRQKRGSTMAFTMAVGSRVKRKRKPAKQTAKFVKRHYDDAGLVQKDHCGWAGFQDHGSQRRVFDSLGEALTKAIFATQKIYFRSYDEIFKPISTFSNTIAYEYKYLHIGFKRYNLDGTFIREVSSIYLFDSTNSRGKTFGEISSEVGELLEQRADVTNNSGWAAFYPCDFFFGSGSSPGSTEDGLTEHDLGDARISLYCKQVITLQNQTLADDGADDQTTAIDANPIKIKAYHFNHKTPRLIDRVHETLRVEQPTTDNFMLDANNTAILERGINTAVNMASADSPLAHAPPAKQWTTNCYAIQDCVLKPGKAKTFTTEFKLSGTFKNVIERMWLSLYRKGTFGRCTWIAARHVHMTPSHTQIRMPFTRKCLMGANVKLVRNKTMLSHYEFTEHT